MKESNSKIKVRTLVRFIGRLKSVIHRPLAEVLVGQVFNLPKFVFSKNCHLDQSLKGSMHESDGAQRSFASALTGAGTRAQLDIRRMPGFGLCDTVR